MAKQSAANIQILARLDDIEAEIQALNGGDAQALTFDDLRATIHRIADQSALIADAIPAIAERLEELARWIASVTDQPAEPPAVAKKTAKKYAPTAGSAARFLRPRGPRLPSLSQGRPGRGSQAGPKGDNRRAGF